MKTYSVTYSVSLCLSIEAENEEEAIKMFYDRVSECEFSRRSLDVEEEK